MGAIWAEVLRAWRMTFIDSFAALREGARSHPGWWAEAHLRKGYLASLPMAAAGIGIAGFLAVRTHSVAYFYLGYLPFGLIAALTWFAIAARSRAKSEEG